MSSEQQQTKKTKKPLTLKVLTAGEGGVGKTTLLQRYIEGVFKADTQMTIGVQFFLKNLEIENNECGAVPCTLQIWDFGGQDRFRSLLKSYANGAKGALVMFDLTRPLTLDKIGQWVEICRAYDDIPIMFLGTKNDLTDQVAIEEDYIKNLMEEYDFVDYLKTSSKTGKNVHKSFRILTKAILKDLDVI